MLALAGTRADTWADAGADAGANTRDRARPKPRGLKRDGPELAAPEPGLGKASRLASWGEAGLYLEHFVIVGVMVLSALGALKQMLG
jgi:hypothetical protein